MSRMVPRRAAKRDAVEREIIDSLTRAGYLVRQQLDFCDLIVLGPDGRTHYLECKSAKGKLRPTQADAIAEGWPVRIVRSVEDAFEGMDD